jgi:hypothetical protein
VVSSTPIVNFKKGIANTDIFFSVAGTGSGLAVLAPPDRGGAPADPMRQMMERLQNEQAVRGGAVPPT